MKYASFFSGIEGFRLALDAAGHECVFSCEIDAFCSKIQEARFGHGPQAGDIKKLRPEEIPDADLWVGGFPCQDLSIAGKRGGIKADRSGLVWRLLELAKVRRPQWFLLENVPGLLSSHRGGDLALLVRGLEELGYVGCLRVLDAQFIGVPQRRRRVFIVGHLGKECPLEVLFEPEGGRRDTAPGGAEGPDAAGAAGGGVEDPCVFTNDFKCSTPKKPNLTRSDTGSGRIHIASSIQASAGHHGHSSPRGDGTDNLVASTLTTAGPDGKRKGWAPNDEADRLVMGTLRGRTRPGSNTDQTVVVPASEVSHAVSKGSGGGLGGRDGQDDYVIQDVRGGTRDKTDQGQDIGIRDDGQCYTLDATSQHAVAFDAHNNPKDKTGTLCGGEKGDGKNEINPPLVAVPDVAGTIKQRMRGATDEVMDSLVAAPLSAGSNPNSNVAGRRREDDENIVLTLRTDQGGANQAPAKADGKSDALGTTGQQRIAIKENQGDPKMGDPSHSQNPITLAIRGRGDSHDLEYRQDGTANAVLTPNGGRAGIGVGAVAFMKTNHTKSTQHPIKVDGKTDRVDTTGQAVVAFDTTQITSKENRSNPQPGDPSHPLASSAHPPMIAASSGQGPLAFDCKAGGNTTFSVGDKPGSLRGEGHGGGHAAVAAPITASYGKQIDSSDRNGGPPNLVAPTLAAKNETANSKATREEWMNTCSEIGMAVRRLTPTECERLQGFADGHTCLCGIKPGCPDRRIPPWIDKEKVKLNGCGHSACGCKCPDSPRYKALGNAVAVPVIRWIADRLPG